MPILENVTYLLCDILENATYFIMAHIGKYHLFYYATFWKMPLFIMSHIGLECVSDINIFYFKKYIHIDIIKL